MQNNNSSPSPSRSTTSTNRPPAIGPEARCSDLLGAFVAPLPPLSTATSRGLSSSLRPRFSSPRRPIGSGSNQALPSPAGLLRTPGSSILDAALGEFSSQYRSGEFVAEPPGPALEGIRATRVRSQHGPSYSRPASPRRASPPPAEPESARFEWEDYENSHQWECLVGARTCFAFVSAFRNAYSHISSNFAAWRALGRRVPTAVRNAHRDFLITHAGPEGLAAYLASAFNLTEAQSLMEYFDVFSDPIPLVPQANGGFRDFVHDSIRSSLAMSDKLIQEAGIVGTLTIIILLGLTAYKVGFKRFTLIAAAASFGFGFVKGLTAELFRDVSDEIAKQESQAQGGVLPFAVTAVIGAVVGKRVPLFTKIVNQRKFTEGLSDMYNGAASGVEAVVNLLIRSFGGKPIELVRHEQGVAFKWADKADKFARTTRLEGAMDSATQEEFFMLHQKGEAILMQWPRDSKEWSSVRKSLDGLARLAADYPGNFTPGRTRAEPVGFMLSGDAGVGKTLAMKWICRYIVAKERPNDNQETATHVFQKSPGPYWEGYAAQLILAFDDIFSKKAMPGEHEGEAETIIKVINQWPLSLNMANCALKGRFQMVSPYVFATTNMEDPADLIKAITCPAAITRRFGLWYHVERDASYDPGDGDIDPDRAWIFRPVDILVDSKLDYASKPAVRFSELCELLISERKRRSQFLGDMDAIMKRWVDAKVVSESAQDARWAAVGPADTPAARAAAAEHLPGASEAVPLVAQGNVASGCVRGLRSAACIAPRRLRGPGTVVLVTAASAYAASRVLQSGVRSTVRWTTDHVTGAIGSKCSKLFTVKAAQIGFLTVTGIILLKKLWGLLCGLTKRPKRVVANARVDEILNKVQANMCEMHCGPGPSLGSGIALDDSTLVCPAHFLTIAAERKTPLEARFKGHTVTLGAADVDHRADIATFTTNASGARLKTRKKGIRHHIAARGVGGDAYLVRPDGIFATRAESDPRRVQYADTSRAPMRERTMFEHSAATAVGDCGCPILLEDAHGKARLLGFHTSAGGAQLSYSAHYTSLAGHRSELQAQARYCGHEVIRELERPLHNGGDTRLEATPFQGALAPCVEAPAPKRPINGIDPMVRAITALSNEWRPLPDSVHLCVDAVLGEVFEAMEGVNLGPVSTWEAIAGVPDLPYAKGLARSKAPGYPLCLKHHDKRSMLGAEGPYVKGPDYADLEAHVAWIKARYREEERAACFRAQLKDEARPLEKCAAGKTRLIAGCDVGFAVVGREQTLRFTSAFMATRHKHGAMPGINPHGVEAQWIYEKLSTRNSGGLAFAGDYAGFDRSQHPDLLSAIWWGITDRLVEHGCDRVMLDGVGRDTVWAHHVGGNCFESGYVYEVDGTLPSGHFMTSILNSLYNMVVLRMAWVDLKGPQAVLSFRDHVYAVYYGDDFAAAPDDDNLDYNLTTLQRYVPRVQMEMTDEDGKPGGAPLKPAGEVGFLRRHFRVDADGGVWMALELASIAGMFDWKKRATPMREHVTNVCAAALLELAAHDDSIFWEYKAKVDRVARECQVPDPSGGLKKSALAYWRSVHRTNVPHWSQDEV